MQIIRESKKNTVVEWGEGREGRERGRREKHQLTSLARGVGSIIFEHNFHHLQRKETMGGGGGGGETATVR